ncbi:unnamed protein product [Cladocopium goreaui]|uniref:Cyclin-dependent kinase inhibitor 3 (CDK2-associated dual-specificity phosphatase) (Kinase-associated phosphatase) n=1 Tax=Cladocopium goreaui TaxID=2562237 RepID=A0A9P1M3U3_9DINO|nr:unnamed protein product [Cladocopium goreaui]
MTAGRWPRLALLCLLGPLNLGSRLAFRARLPQGHSCGRSHFSSLAAKRGHFQQRKMEMYVLTIPELKGAEIAICPCPGKRDRDLGSDLESLKTWGAEAVVTLVQDDELQMLDVADMGAQVRTRQMQWFHCPVPDFAAPGMYFEGAWVQRGDGAKVREILKRGGKVVVHCRGGIGRAGTVSCRLLVELGVCSPEKALLWVRETRPGAVETWEQENHVLSLRSLEE